MDALGGCGDVEIGGTKIGGTNDGRSAKDPVDHLLRDVRRDMERGDAEFDVLRSERVFKQVMSRIEQNRQRGFWTRLLRTMRVVTVMALTVWNSRAVRLLVP
jgi:hypothetical protein